MNFLDDGIAYMAELKEWTLHVNKDFKVHVEGIAYDPYQVRLEREIRMLEAKGPKAKKKLDKLKKLRKTLR